MRPILSLKYSTCALDAATCIGENRTLDLDLDLELTGRPESETSLSSARDSIWILPRGVSIDRTEWS